MAVNFSVRLHLSQINRARALQSCILYCCSKQLDFLTVLHLPGRASRLASNVAKAVAVATAS